MSQLENLRYLNNNSYNTQLEFLTKFNILNNLNQVKLNKIILTFSFKDINFNEDKVIPFFFALELISGQKGTITLAKKPSVSLQVRKGMLSGCKVTLRKKNLYRFLDYLNLTIPRLENFDLISIKKIQKNKSNAFNLMLTDLFSFYQLESELDPNIKLLQIIFIFNTTNFEEKIFSLSSNSLPIKI
jgi:large subunit ribosomal protein L5